MTMREISVAARTHGRVLVEEPDASEDARGVGLIVAFHGYGQAADDILSEVRRIAGAAAWRLAAPQALHRFYTKGDRAVVGSWMTRQDRDEAIADNVAYVDAVLDTLLADAAAATGPSGPIVFAGFSQGAAMAYRAAILGRRQAAGVIALAGDVPPDLGVAETGRRWPRVLIGAGDADGWYNSDKVSADVARLDAAGAPHEVVRFRGGHEWTDEFRAAAGGWLTGFSDSLIL
jgi:predicted esterase